MFGIYAYKMLENGNWCRMFLVDTAQSHRAAERKVDRFNRSKGHDPENVRARPGQTFFMYDDLS
jgi:hypothetical protein